MERLETLAFTTQRRFEQAATAAVVLPLRWLIVILLSAALVVLRTRRF